MRRMREIAEVCEVLFSAAPESGWPSFGTAVPANDEFWEHPIPDFLQPFLSKQDSGQGYDLDLCSRLAQEAPFEWRNLLEVLVTAYFSSFALEEFFNSPEN